MYGRMRKSIELENEPHAEIINRYLETCNPYVPSEPLELNLRDYLKFAEENNIKDPSEIPAEVLQKYVITRSQKDRKDADEENSQSERKKKNPIIYRYPAQVYVEESGVSVIFPDLPGCLPSGSDVDEAMINAKEALAQHMYEMEQEGDTIPEPTSLKNIDAEDGAMIVLVEAFMPSIRDRENRRVVEKTVTIPAWLNAEAEAKHVNFSHVLHEGLVQYLANV